MLDPFCFHVRNLMMNLRIAFYVENIYELKYLINSEFLRMLRIRFQMSSSAMTVNRFRKIGHDELITDVRHQIASFFLDAGCSMNVETGECVPVEEDAMQKMSVNEEEVEEGHDELNLANLPEDVLLLIFGHLGGMKYTRHQLNVSAKNEKKKQMFALMKPEDVSATKLYRLRGVCRRFNQILTSPNKQLPTVPIGLKISCSTNQDPYFSSLFDLHMYGGPGSSLPCINAPPNRFSIVTHPGLITPNLSVCHVVLDDELMSGLMSLDLSMVEEVFIYDIVDCRLTNPVEQMTAFMNKLTSVMNFECSGVGQIQELFSSEVLKQFELRKKVYSAHDLIKYHTSMCRYAMHRRKRSSHRDWMQAKRSVRHSRGLAKTAGYKKKLRSRKRRIAYAARGDPACPPELDTWALRPWAPKRAKKSELFLFDLPFEEIPKKEKKDEDEAGPSGSA